MVSMSATISAGDVASFNAALKEYASALGKNTRTAPRRAAIQICKSLRHGTKEAKRRRPVVAQKIDAPSSMMPKWLSGPSRRLCDVKFPDRPHLHGIYRYIPAEERADIQRNAKKMFGTLYRQKERRGGTRGLAKLSWGWCMHNIFKGSAPDAPWYRRKRDKRNPKDATKESTSAEREGVVSSTGYARICNRLDYIESALKISVDEAVSKAQGWILKQVERIKMRKT